MVNRLFSTVMSFRKFTSAGVLLCLLTLLVSWQAVQADVWHMSCFLDASQVTPPTDSLATGEGVIRYDDETNLLDVDVTLYGITLDEWTASHIHVGRKGFSGPWNINLGPIEEWFEDNGGIRRILNSVVYPESEEFNMITDGTFIMVHTLNWPSGEIRGQLIAEPRLSHTALVRGSKTYFQVTGAQAGEEVTFVYSDKGLGASPPISALGGMTLDIQWKLYVIGTAFADDNGSAVLSATVPKSLPLIDLWLQAVIRRGVNGENSVKSNTQTTALLP